MYYRKFVRQVVYLPELYSVCVTKLDLIAKPLSFCPRIGVKTHLVTLQLNLYLRTCKQIKCDGKKFGSNTVRNKLSQYSSFMFNDNII
jgi:hypothetical protein